jgi:hypothetical protein
VEIKAHVATGLDMLIKRSSLLCYPWLSPDVSGRLPEVVDPRHLVLGQNPNEITDRNLIVYQARERRAISGIIIFNFPVEVVRIKQLPGATELTPSMRHIMNGHDDGVAIANLLPQITMLLLKFAADIGLKPFDETPK